MSDIDLNLNDVETVKMTVTLPMREVLRLAEQISNLRYALERIHKTELLGAWEMQQIAREALE